MDALRRDGRTAPASSPPLQDAYQQAYAGTHQQAYAGTHQQAYAGTHQQAYADAYQQAYAEQVAKAHSQRLARLYGTTVTSARPGASATGTASSTKHATPSPAHTLHARAGVAKTLSAFLWASIVRPVFYTVLYSCLCIGSAYIMYQLYCIIAPIAREGVQRTRSQRTAQHIRQRAGGIADRARQAYHHYRWHPVKDEVLNRYRVLGRTVARKSPYLLLSIPAACLAFKTILTPLRPDPVPWHQLDGFEVPWYMKIQRKELGSNHLGGWPPHDSHLCRRTFANAAGQPEATVVTSLVTTTIFRSETETTVSVAPTTVTRTEALSIMPSPPPCRHEIDASTVDSQREASPVTSHIETTISSQQTVAPPPTVIAKSRPAKTSAETRSATVIQPSPQFEHHPQEPDHVRYTIGNRNAFCETCGQFHCCELPYPRENPD